MLINNEIKISAACFYRVIVITLLLFVRLSTSYAQLHPVQVTTQLVPPYSVYLADYATSGNDKLRLVVVQRDISKSSYQVRLRFSLQLNGTVVLQTSNTFHPPPINLDPGVPMFIEGIDLQPYFDSRNLDFIGISRDEYERTKALPEGNYEICVTAYDYLRQDIAVSVPGCSFFFLAKDEPPLLNFPACGTALAVKSPQQIIFSWFPRNTSSPNSADQTEYEFSLYETRPAGRIPNDVVLSSNPIFKTTTSSTQLIYGMAEPLLFENMVYVWRVQAKDKSGRDQFRNNGFSEPCTFNYGGTTSNVQLGAVEDVRAEGKAPKKGLISWSDMKSNKPEVDGYTVSYKKKSASKWFTQESKEDSTAIFDLEPNTEYQVQVQAHAGPILGPYSDIVKFKTPAIVPPQCGDPIPPIDASTDPLLTASSGMTIDVQGFEIILNEVQSSGQGLYSGKGILLSGPYFGSATFHVTFKDIFINTSRIATKGRVDFVTKKLGDWIEKELEDQRKRELADQQEKNREDWKGTDFYSKEIVYDFVIDSIAVQDDGSLTITDANDKTYTNSEIAKILIDSPGKAVIIEDKNGNQWVVQKDVATGEVKITAAPGGGLSPTMDVVVSGEALEIVKQAVVELSIKYNKDKMVELAGEVEMKESLLTDHVDEYSSGSSDDIDIPDGDGGDNPPANDDPSIQGEGVVKEGDEIDDEIHKILRELSELFYAVNREYRVGNVVSELVLPDNIDGAVKVIAQELKIDINDKTMTVTEFIEQQKTLNMADKDIVRQVALKVEDLLGTLLMESEALKDIKFEFKKDY